MIAKPVDRRAGNAGRYAAGVDPDPLLSVQYMKSLLRVTLQPFESVLPSRCDDRSKLLVDFFCRWLVDLI